MYPLFTWSLPACPSMRTGTFSLSVGCISAPQTAPSTWKGLRTTTKGRKGGKNTGRKVFTWASTICSMYLNSFHLPKSRDIHYWFCLYIQGPSLRMLSDLSQGHSAQTSMLMLTRYLLHSRPGTRYFPSRNLTNSSPYPLKQAKYFFADKGSGVKFRPQCYLGHNANATEPWS